MYTFWMCKNLNASYRICANITKVATQTRETAWTSDVKRLAHSAPKNFECTHKKNTAECS